MRKKRLTFYCITLALFCQVYCPVMAVSEAQKDVISDHCATIQEGLKSVQKTDARMRVYLGSHYSTVLTKFMMPLNLRLVENNISEEGLVESQSATNAAREKFNEDFVEYQRGLEELIATDCRAEAERFYERLVKVRGLRAEVREDVSRMKERILEHIAAVRKLAEKMKTEEGSGAGSEVEK